LKAGDVKSITPDKFLQLAKKIVSNSTAPEEEARTAISRAYYSLYHETLGIMKSKHSIALINNIKKHSKKKLRYNELNRLNSLDPTFIRRYNLHRIIPDTLYDLKKTIIASKFKNFRIARNDADYVLTNNISCSDANIVVQNIDNLLTVVKATL
jgi:hypothetical protein